MMDSLLVSILVSSLQESKELSSIKYMVPKKTKSHRMEWYAFNPDLDRKSVLVTYFLAKMIRISQKISIILQNNLQVSARCQF